MLKKIHTTQFKISKLLKHFTKEDVQIQQDLNNIYLENANLKPQLSTSLVVQWLRIYLPMQET